MIPNEPLPATGHQPPATRSPFWNYSDLLLFVLLAIPSLGVAFLAAAMLTAFTKLSMPFRLVFAQMLWYVLAFGALKALLFLRYQQPFWRSLGWLPLRFGTATASLFAGPILAVALGLVGSALHTPEIPLPFQQMLKDPPTIVVLGLLVVVIGPLCEELAFRGLLMPLLIRSMGPAAGIIIAGIVFGCSHGYEYEWSWRHMILISGAGCVFGWARFKSGSTAAAAYVHATFNFMQFAAFLIQSRTI